MINYFILNTSQFLNQFGNVSEKKIHNVDEKLDELEALIMIFEAKMESIPEEAFNHPPMEEAEEGLDEDFGQNNGGLAMTDGIVKQNIAMTENALAYAGANPKSMP